MKLKSFLQGLLCCLTIGCCKKPKSKKKQGRCGKEIPCGLNFIGGEKTYFRQRVYLEILYQRERGRLAELRSEEISKNKVTKDAVSKLHMPSLIVCFGGAFIIDTQVKNNKKIANTCFINIILYIIVLTCEELSSIDYFVFN